jgi:TRAP-type C4-dicarboxylate transport system permease small subunit
MIKILHKAGRMLVSIIIGKLAAAMFKKAWRATAHEDEVPKPTDARVGWGEVVLAAALEGMLIAVVKAVVDRAAAESTHKLTGVWVGEHADEAEQHGVPAQRVSSHDSPQDREKSRHNRLPA